MGMFVITVLMVISYCLLMKLHQTQNKSNKLKFGAKAKDKILVVTAHPDDECMFFSPTIIYFKEKGLEVNILCLTNGGYDGLGKQRAYELYKSSENFNIPLGQVSISNKFEDNPTIEYNAAKVAEVIKNQIKKHEITHVVTFDNYGVSGHKNHQSCFHGAKFLQKQNSFPHVKFFALDSVSVLRKYIQVVDLLPSLLVSKLTGSDTKLVLASPAGYFQGYKSMLCHASQLVWFRRLFIILSRYMFINNFVEIES